jgi:pimeloyl-ACP methyl ester carboxylesterase
LNALLLLPESVKGVVIYFHGNRSHLAHHLPHTKKFTEAGYAVLISDYRGFGKSTGKLTEHHFSSDALMWYQKVSQQFPPDKIIVYGRSLGTAAASWLAAHEGCSQLILEAPYYNMYDLARRYGMLIPDGNYLSFSFRNDEHLPKVKVPITILHGTKDKVVSPRSAYRLKKFLKSGDQFIEISGARHKDLGNFPEFNQIIWKLLE